MQRMASSFCPDLKVGISPTHSLSPRIQCLENIDIHQSNVLHCQLDRIQNELLQRFDPLTARHMLHLGIEPEMYLLRWVRLLMSREFPMYQVWAIWDAIFSLSPVDFSFLDILCLAALREFRDEILAQDDASGVLQLLRDLGERIEADKLIDSARELHDDILIASALEATSGSKDCA